MSSKFTVLLVGSGGREYAFLWKLLRSPEVTVHVAPGLSGMLYFLSEEERSRVKLHPAVKANDIKALCQLAQEIKPDLVVVGPEDPLILGLANDLQKLGFKVFGFTKQAAALEGDKWWCKSVYWSCRLPTATGTLLHSSSEIHSGLERYVLAGRPVVLKCNGVAQGKGVLIVPLDHPEYWGENQRLLRQMFDPNAPLGFVADRVIIEECYPVMDEWSAMTMMGNNGFRCPLMPTKDHKLFHGLNTGGMGVIAPAPGFGIDDMVSRKGAINLVQAFLAAEEIDMVGVLYEGMNRMLGNDYLVEVNVRGGDPETQVQLEFIKGVYLHELLLAAVEGRPEVARRVRVPEDLVLVGVVMASSGYPGSYKKGAEVTIPEHLPAPGMIFPAGLAWENEKLLTAGGRVLMAVGEGKSISEARNHAYAIVNSIKHGGALVWRDDIGLV